MVRRRQARPATAAEELFRPPSAAEEFHRAVLAALPNGVVVADPSGAIAYVNPAAVSMFGYDDPEELLGRRLEVLVPQQLRALHADQSAEFRREPHSRPMGIGLELRGLRRDGTEFPAEIGLAPIRLPEGVHVAASIVDIGLRTRMEIAVRSELARERSADSGSAGSGDLAFPASE